MLRVLLAGIVLLALVPGHAAAQETTCRTAFEVTIHEGPSAPATLLGFLTISVGPDGAIVGTLAREDGPLMLEGALTIPGDRATVVGQATGRAVNLLVDLGEGRYVIGVGTAQQPLSGCAGLVDGVLGGPAVGPQSGDRGDWIGGAVICIFRTFCCDVRAGRCGSIVP
ncbi:MAG: hypothetical protein U0556_15030 [Dehalococcoidia bacterium]